MSHTKVEDKEITCLRVEDKEEFENRKKVRKEGG